MKSERRHELQTNDLAVWIQARWKEIQPYTSHIILGVLGVVVLVAVISYLAGRSGNNPPEAWQSYMNAVRTDTPDQRISQLIAVAEEAKFAGTPASVWARLSLAEARLQRGARDSFADRSKGRADLEAARDDFKQVLDSYQSLSVDQEMLHRRALFGLAQTYESLGDVEGATEHYEKVAEQWPDSTKGETAARQAELLSRGMGDWLAWFKDAEMPKSEAVSGTTPGGGFDHGGLGSGFLDDLPGVSNPPTPGTLTNPIDGRPLDDGNNTLDDLFNDSFKDDEGGGTTSGGASDDSRLEDTGGDGSGDGEDTGVSEPDLGDPGATDSTTNPDASSGADGGDSTESTGEDAGADSTPSNPGTDPAAPDGETNETGGTEVPDPAP